MRATKAWGRVVRSGRLSAAVAVAALPILALSVSGTASAAVGCNDRGRVQAGIRRSPGRPAADGRSDPELLGKRPAALRRPGRGEPGRP